MTSALSWQNSISLCPASFCTPRPKLPVTPGVSWLPTSVYSTPHYLHTISISPRQPLNYFWSLLICLLWIFSYKLNHTICALLWLISLCIMFLRFVHIIICTTSSLLFFFLLNSIPLYGNDILFIHSSAGHLGWFHFEAIMNNAAMNICVQVFVKTCFHFSWAYIQEWNYPVI